MSKRAGKAAAARRSTKSGRAISRQGSVRTGSSTKFARAAGTVLKGIEEKKEYRAKLGPKIRQFIMESKSGNTKANEKLHEVKPFLKVG